MSNACDTIRVPGLSSLLSFGISFWFSDGSKYSVTTVASLMSVVNRSAFMILTLSATPLFWTFSFALCGLTVVEFRGGRAVLRAHNLTEHLAPLHDEEAQAEAEERTRSGAL